jgi:hypothetical protein
MIGLTILCNSFLNARILFMTKEINQIELISSILNVKASGVDVSYDLQQNDGKSIAELLDDQKKRPKQG